MRIRKIRNETIGATLFIIVFLLSFRFFSYIDGNIGHNWDWPFPSLNFFYNNLKNYSLYTWNTYNLGYVNDLTITHLTPNLIFSIAGRLTGTTLFLFLLFFLTTLTAFYGFKRLLDFLIKDSFLNYIPSLLYAFSPFLFNDIIGGSWVMWVSYAFCPIYFVLLVRYLTTSGNKYLLFSLLISIFVMIALQNLVLINLLILLYLINEIIVIKSLSLRGVIKRSFIFLTLMIFINTYWILPFSSTFFDFTKNTVLSDGGIHAFDPIRNSQQSIWNIFNLGGYLDRNMYLYSMPLALKNFFYVIVVLAWFAIASCFLKEKNKIERQKIIFWIISLLMLIVIVKGGNRPFSGFTLWLYESFPLMKLYRSPQHLMFIPAFIIPILITFSINYFYENSRYKKTVLAGFSLIVMIWISGWWYNGDIGHKTLMEQKRDHIDFYQLPPELSKYYEITQKDTTDYRTFFLPAVNSPNYLKTKYQNEAAGYQPEYLYLDKPTFTSEANRFANDVEISFCKEPNDFNYIKYLSLFSVKDIVLRSDIVPHHTESSRCWNNSRTKRILDSEPAIESFLVGEYAVSYRIKDNYFLPHIYSASEVNIISGRENSLVLLTRTSYLDGYPALAFTEQQSKDSLQSIVNSQQSVFNKQILFANSKLNELIIDLAKAEAKSKSWQLAGNGQKPILVKLNKNGKGKFKVKDGGVYEVWIKNTENLARFNDWGLEVDIDGEELKGWEGREGDKWIKVGEKELEGQFNWFDWLKGKHRITVTTQELTDRTFGKEEFKKMVQNMEVMIVSKDKVKEYEDLLKSKDIGYLFYIDEEKIGNMLKDEERLKEIKLKEENPFRIGKQEFYVPEDGSYSIKALVKPKRDFLEGGFVSSSSSSIRTSLDALSGWDVNALNTTYQQNISEDGIHINAYFQNTRDVKESVVLTKKFPDIRIRKMPYLAFSCEMEDLGVQGVEIDVNLTDKSKWFSLFRTKKIRLKADNKQYVINLYQKAKDIFGKEAARNLSINEITLKFKKRDGVDLSREKDRHVYPFKFKAIGFFKTPPILIDFKDRLFAYLPDNYYYFDTNGDLRGVDFLEQIPSWNVKDVYRLHLNRFIDLKEIPVLSLNFPKPSMADWREDWRFEDGEWRTEFPQEWKVLLGLDFDGDEKEDEKIEMFVPAAGGMSDGNLLLTVRAYEEVKKRFPDKQNYNLISIGVSHPDDKEIFYQTVMSKKLTRYREHIYKPSDLSIGAGVLELDGKIYKLPLEAKGDRQKIKDEKNNWVEFNNIQLEEGEHSLNVFENDRFKVEMVEIKTVNSQQLIVNSQEPPKIEFKKINPTRYVVDMKGVKGPFTLVFSESFHEGWKGYIRQGSGVRGQGSDKDQKTAEPWSALWGAWMDRGNREEIKDHFVVNSYANGWIVPAKQESGVRSQKSGVISLKSQEEDFEIVLEYKPQRLFEIGLMVSGVTLLGCVGYLGYGWVRGYRRRNEPIS